MSRPKAWFLELALEPDFNPVDSLVVSGSKVAFLNDGAAEALFQRLTAAMEPDAPDHDSDYCANWAEAWERIGSSLRTHCLFGNDGGDFWVFDEPDWRFHYLIHITRPEIIDAAFFNHLNAAMRSTGDPDIELRTALDFAPPRLQ